MDVEGNTILLYDRGAKKLPVYNKSRELYSKEFDYPIISASLSDRGALLVITETQRYIAEVTVFDKLGGQLFKWYSLSLIHICAGNTMDALAARSIGRQW